MKRRGKAAKGANREEKMREAAERERESKRTELRRELEMGDMNARRLRKTWRAKMMSLNLPVIKEDLQVAWRTFDRALDNKDYSISVLLDAVDTAEEQKKQADAGHMDRLDRLLELHKQQLNDNNTFYESRVDYAVDSVHGQMGKMEEEQNESENFLRTLTFGTKKKYDDALDNIGTKNLSKLDTRKEDNENIRRLAKSMLKRRLRKYSEDLANFLHDHEESIKKKRKDYAKIKKKDDEDQRIIHRQSLRIVNFYEAIPILKKKIANYHVIAEKEIGDYRFECNYFHDAYTTLQNRFQEEQILDREQLKITTVEYNKTLVYLEEHKSKVEKIVSMVDLCQKYETYNDKILLCPLSTINETICFKITSTGIETTKIEEITKQIQPMEKFLKLISQVEKEVVKLKHQLENLNKESNGLKSFLKTYMDKFSEPPPLTKTSNANKIPLIINPKDLIKLKS